MSGIATTPLRWRHRVTCSPDGPGTPAPPGIVNTLTLSDSQQLARKGDEQIVRVRLDPEPSLIVTGFQDRGHTIMDSSDKVVRRCGQDRKRAHPLTRGGSFQFSHRPAIPKGDRSFIAIA